MKNIWLIMAFSFVVGCSSTKQSVQQCGDHGSLFKVSHTNKISKVQLLPKPNEPSFYIFVGENYRFHHYVVYVKPEDLVKEIKTRIEQAAFSSDKLFLEKIEGDLPLKSDTDILKFGLTNQTLMEVPLRHVVSLLETGRASLVDLWEFTPNTIVKEIQVSNLESTGGKFRDICNANGTSILQLTDIIYN